MYINLCKNLKNFLSLKFALISLFLNLALTSDLYSFCNQGNL